MYIVIHVMLVAVGRHVLFTVTATTSGHWYGYRLSSVFRCHQVNRQQQQQQQQLHTINHTLL